MPQIISEQEYSLWYDKSNTKHYQEIYWLNYTWKKEKEKFTI